MQAGGTCELSRPSLSVSRLSGRPQAQQPPRGVGKMDSSLWFSSQQDALTHSPDVKDF